MADRHSKPRDTTPLDTEENLAYQRKSWRVQRVGWVLMGLCVVLGMLGLFGDGPLTRARAGSAGGFEVRYSRVWRLQTETQVELTAIPDSAGQVIVTLEGSLLRRARIRSVSPEPRRIEAVPGGQRFVFDARGDGPVSLQLGITPTSMGRLRTRLATTNSASVPLTVLVLP